MEKALLTDTPAIFDKTVRQLLAAHHKHFEERRNAIHLMQAFTAAAQYKKAVPKWVISELNAVFRQYLYGTFEGKKDRSLDRLFGLTKGKGQSPATEEFNRRDRDVQLMTTMDMLIRHGVSRMDAAEIASGYCNRSGGDVPTIHIGKTNQKYDEWKKRLEKIRQYHDSPKDILPFVSKGLREEYAAIFK